MAMARAMAPRKQPVPIHDATDTFVDTDSDGLSDAYEDANGLDKANADDANQIRMAMALATKMKWHQPK